MDQIHEKQEMQENKSSYWDPEIHRYSRELNKYIFRHKTRRTEWVIFMYHVFDTLTRITIYFKMDMWVQLTIKPQHSPPSQLVIQNSKPNKGIFYYKTINHPWKWIHKRLFGTLHLYITREDYGNHHQFVTLNNLNNLNYFHRKSDTGEWYAYAVAHHWKTKYLRKRWLKRNRNLCQSSHFFPYFWKMLVLYLY